MRFKRKAILVAKQDWVTERLLYNGINFPLVIEPESVQIDLLSWVLDSVAAIKRKIYEHGAVLLRGFRVEDADKFGKAMEALAPNLMEYMYRSTPRHSVGMKIYTASEYPAHQTIPLHNEMSYTNCWPSLVAFYCQKKAASGGFTLLANSARVFQHIPVEIREKFIKNNITYVRNYGEELDLSWQEVFQTESKNVVEAFCKASDIEYKWINERYLRTRQTCQAIIHHPTSGEPIWFNQAHLFHVSSLDREVRESLEQITDVDFLPRNVFYGNGEAIDTGHLNEIRSIYSKESIKFDLCQGDVLILDNLKVAHGRGPFEGDRRILVVMGTF